DFQITVLARMQIEHEINQRPLEFRTRAGKTNESAPAQLRRALQVEDLQFLAERNVIEHFPGQLRLLPPLANDFVRARVFSERHALVRNVWNFEKEIFLLFVEDRGLLVEIRNVNANLSHLVFQIFRSFTARFPCADLLTQTVALRLQLLQLRLDFPPVCINA